MLKSVQSFVSNVSLASLVNKSQIMSRAFYKMQGSVLSFYAVFLGNNESSYKEEVSSFLTQLIDVSTFIFPYFFSSFLHVTGNKILCIQNIKRKKGFTGHLRCCSWRFFQSREMWH